VVFLPLSLSPLSSLSHTTSEIPPSTGLLEPEFFTEVQRVDSKSTMLYVCEIFERFKGQLSKFSPIFTHPVRLSRGSFIPIPLSPSILPPSLSHHFLLHILSHIDIIGNLHPPTNKPINTQQNQLLSKAFRSTTAISTLPPRLRLRRVVLALATGARSRRVVLMWFRLEV